MRGETRHGRRDYFWETKWNRSPAEIFCSFYVAYGRELDGDNPVIPDCGFWWKDGIVIERAPCYIALIDDVVVLRGALHFAWCFLSSLMRTWWLHTLPFVVYLDVKEEDDDQYDFGLNNRQQCSGLAHHMRGSRLESKYTQNQPANWFKQLDNLKWWYKTKGHYF